MSGVTGATPALLTKEQIYEDGTSPQVLDILDVHLLEHRPDGCQIENWLVDGTLYWDKRGEADPQAVIDELQPPETLFTNAGSTSAGLNDQIPTALADGVAGSLLLVYVPEVELCVFNHYGKIKCQAKFKYNGVRYWIGVTDPIIEAEYRPRGVADYDLGPCLLTVSLSAPLVKEVDNISYRFKLVAAIISMS